MRDIAAGYIGINPFDDSDFTGAASIFVTEADYIALQNLSPTLVDQTIVRSFFNEGFFDLDLVIESANFQYADFHRLDEELGDTFSIHYYGKSPIMLMVSGRMFDLAGNGAKHALMAMYRDIFRLSKVAKYKIVPNLEFIGCIASGSLLNLSISENSQSDDILSITFQFLINNLYYSSPDNPGRIKFSSIEFDRASSISESAIRSTTWPSVG